MSLEKIIVNKLKQMNKPIKQTGKDFIMTTCLNPQHNEKNPSFSINIKSGRAKCFACGFTINKNYWFDNVNEEEIDRQIIYQTLKEKLNQVDEYINDLDEIILPPKNLSIDILLDESNKYRGIKKETFEKLNVYITTRGKYQNRLIFPIQYDGKNLAFETKSLEQELNLNNNFKGKYVHSKGFDSKTLIYPYNLLKQMNKNYIVLVEGIFDAITGYELGIPTIANWGVALNFNNKKIATLYELGIDTIYLAFDKDQAGIKATNDYLKSYLSNYFDIKLGIELDELKDFYRSNYKDLNDFYRFTYKNT